MTRRFHLLALLLASLAAAPGQAQVARPITADDLRAHVAILADDRFEGRAPGTNGERLTTDYIIRALAARGVEPAAANGQWLQPVPLVERSASSHRLSVRRDGRSLAVPADALVFNSRDDRVRIADAPVVFAGHGAVMPDRGIDQLAGADLRGAVALIMYEGPQVEGFPSFNQRLRTLKAAGARAVIGIAGPDLPWEQVRRLTNGRAVQLDDPDLPEAFGALSWEGASALARDAGLDLAGLLNEQPGSSFRSRTLPLRVDLDVTAQLRRFTSHNVIGRVRGTGGGAQNVLMLAHWDHLGICRPEGEADRICNGAVDNASGIATLIEAAGRVATGTRPDRDVLVLATTGEESGLVGAEYFARNPPVARERIVAGFNADTMAVAPAGTPVTVIGGTPAMHALIGRVAIGLGRRLDTDRDADIMATRQDGWALTRNGIPTVMAVSNASDMDLLRTYLAGSYHKPDDEIADTIEYGGAVEDANLLVALARAFADPAQFPTPARDAGGATAR